MRFQPCVARWFAVLIVLFSAAGRVAEAAEQNVARPKLVLFLSIDHFRPDYLTRFSDLFAPAVGPEDKVYGGFEYLKSRGAWFIDARHVHYPLFTGPGHAVLLTGAQPYKNGIVGNYWFDRHEKNGRRYCVEDLSPVSGSSSTTEKERFDSLIPLFKIGTVKY